MQKKTAGDIDVAVIGGGPAGSFSAYELAKKGLNVTVFEEHSQIGYPSHCAGHLSIRSLKNLNLYPLPKGIIENEFSIANFYSPNGTQFSVHLNKPVTCAVNRAKFDIYLANKAQNAGASYRLETRVESLHVKDNFIKGVEVVEQNSVKMISSKIVIDAEGISSRFIRQAKLNPLCGEKLVFGVEAEVDTVKDVEKNGVEVYIGENYAPGFYGWLIPRLDGTAKIGLATNKGNPKIFLDHLIKRHPIASKQLKNAKITQQAFHAITLGGPIPKTYANGFLAVGDAASQVKATTGGGIIFSILCAKIASQVAKEALDQNNFSEKFLQPYQKQCAKRLSFDSKVMCRARSMINSFSDEQLNNTISFCSRINLGKSLSNIDEIDFQGQTLFTLLRKPAAYAALMYLCKLFLSANA
ncbi:MAG: NAD(P)/FAD-dependent oxidoreductase [Crenarchaeota archaeon]|nr:NAD(P)/FAD-dependent oxidoreductase [Thermoproteota archaeon]